jgi:phosphatidylethanolamine-binding protein (PEBP) family uncharacterized protein
MLAVASSRTARQKAMQNHILARTELIGTYQRQ